MKRLRAATLALPGAIALLTSTGLSAALPGDGARDALAWLGLGLIALLGGWPLLPRWRRNKRGRAADDEE